MNERNIDCHIELIGPYLASSIGNSEDEACGRFACGLVSDLSNYLERDMIKYAEQFMKCLQVALAGQEFNIETKLHAMIAVGDICLAIEEHFQQYLEETMGCLFGAA